MTPRVDVVVVSYETRDLLGRCLESLEADHRCGLATVTVVDNASGDGSADLVRERFEWARVIASPDNLGFGAAANLGAHEGAAEWLAPMNADVRVRPGALAALLAAGDADPGAAIVAPRLVLPDGSAQHSVHPFPGPGLALIVNLGLHRLPGLASRLCIEPNGLPDHSRRVGWAHGALLLVRRQEFEAVRGFDPAQWLYAEDIDLAWRLRRRGLGVRYEPAAVAEHDLSAATEAAFGEQRQERHLDATFEWMHRRRGPRRTGAYAALNVAGNAGRWLALWLPSRLRPDRFGRSRARAARAIAANRAALRLRRGRG